MAVHLTRIYTKTGDDGTTALGDFSRVAKTDVRLAAYADTDEANAAIGVAVTIAALAVLNAALVAPFPEVTAQQELVRVSLLRNCGRPDCWIRMATSPDYAHASQTLTGVRGLAAYAIGDIVASLPDARSVQGVMASANYFDVLGVRPAMGRLFHAADADTRAPIAVIAHRMWVRDFDADPLIVGRSIRVGDALVNIVGVAPPSFEGIERPRPAGRRRSAA